MLELLETWGPGPFLRVSAWLYPLLNATHILAIGTLVGSALLMDLRVLGLFARRLPAETVIGLLQPAAIAGLVVAVGTGVLLFSVQPADYLGNPAFRIKLVVLALAVGNAIAFTFAWRGTPGPGFAASALASILLWVGALVAGRYIGFLN